VTPGSIFLLFQAAEPEAGQLVSPTWILLAVALLCIIGAGLRFFRCFFQAYFLPHLSLRRLAEEEHFFYSLALVFAGSALFVVGLSMSHPAMDKIAEEWVVQTVQNETSSSSSNYKDVAQAKAEDDLRNDYELIFKTNILVLPLVPVVFWILFMSLTWLIAKLFHTPITYAHFMRTMGYNGLIFGAGAGAMFYYQTAGIAGTEIPGWVTPVALILGIYAVIHLVISFMQGLDLAPIGIIVSVVIALAIIAGIGYLVMYQWGLPAWNDYWSEINAYDPSRGSV
jgi:hypothetical protein